MYAIRLLRRKQKNLAVYFPLNIFHSVSELFQAYITENKLDPGLFVGSSVHRKMTWRVLPRTEETEVVVFANKYGAMYFIQFLHDQTHFILSNIDSRDVLIPEEVPASIMEREREKYLPGV